MNLVWCTQLPVLAYAFVSWDLHKYMWLLQYWSNASCQQLKTWKLQVLSFESSCLSFESSCSSFELSCSSFESRKQRNEDLFTVHCYCFYCSFLLFCIREINCFLENFCECLETQNWILESIEDQESRIEFWVKTVNFDRHCIAVEPGIIYSFVKKAQEAKGSTHHSQWRMT